MHPLLTPTRFDELVDPDGAAVDDEPLTLPAAWTPPPRPPIPLVAAVVPVVGAVGLWLVTGSVLSLWLAVLGPLIAVATLLDARRAARRDRRRADAESAGARARVASAIDARHARERARAWARTPDVLRLATRPDDIWRARGEAPTLVVGAGDAPSALRVAGGDGDPEAAALRRRAARLADAPIEIPATDGVAVVGHGLLATAVQRALVAQAGLTFAPGELRMVGALPGELAWAEALPHREAASGLALAAVGPGGRVPEDADIVIARCLPGDPLPPRCAAVVTVASLADARLEHRGESVPLAVEAIGRDQAAAIADALAERARDLGFARSSAEAVALGALVAASPPQPDAGALAAVVGVADGAPIVIDLVADGPHAVVAGVTGSGKSELLITWVLSLCRTHGPEQVTFLLADFKGGTAFDALAAVPHVTGVITDLDGSGARRAIESLRAELRRREAVIAGAGARDILDPRVRMPRLVVVVDEFAALLGEHPELQALFADVAARGRALGIHLVLGTQRAAGVVRDALLANCPLRISLRVTDPADSRALIGTDEAARLPGGARARGAALVRRAGDGAPVRVQIALSGPDDLTAATAHPIAAAPQRPWLPSLPQRLELDELRRRAGAPADAILLGLSDEPARQRQRAIALAHTDRALLVLGGPRSGVTGALALIGAQAPGEVRRVPADPEGLWDAVAALDEAPPAAGAVVLVDDLDAVAAALPPDCAQLVVERLEALLRRAGGDGLLVAMGAHRLTGVVARLGDLAPRRLVLPYGSRADHIAAGGEADAFDPSAPPGRGTLDGLTIQVAHVEPAIVTAADRAEPAPWHPGAPLTGLIARRSPTVRQAVSTWADAGLRIVAVDDYAADPSIVASGPVVVTGEPDDWQRHWRLLADVRGDHDLVVDASCAAELRALGGVRGVPPYCEPGRRRAWLIRGGADPVRIVLPDGAARSLRRDAPGGAPADMTGRRQRP